MSSEYEPGVCNIGPGEQRRRFRLGTAGIIATAVWVAVVLGFRLPSWALIAAVGPLFAGFMGILLARERFCAGFALQGVFDAGTGRESVDNESARRTDRHAAYRLIARAAAYALAVALALFLVGRLLL